LWALAIASRTAPFINFPTERELRGEGCSEGAKKSKNLMKYRKDSEAGRLAVLDTAAMQSEGTMGVHHRPERSLRQSLAAGVIALEVAKGVERLAYTPSLPGLQERFDLSNAAADAGSRFAGTIDTSHGKECAHANEY
jgi:hypothetical protein